jgi:hypothetical protein
MHPGPVVGGKPKLRNVLKGGLAAFDLNVIDMGAQYYMKGEIDFGTLSDTGEKISVGPGGIGVETHLSHQEFALPQDMRMLTPKEAEKTLKDGEYFVNRSGPMVNAMSSTLHSIGNYEWFELWEIRDGKAFNTGCKTETGSFGSKEVGWAGSGLRSGYFGQKNWVEANLRQIWNKMSFRCPPKQFETEA